MSKLNWKNAEVTIYNEWKVYSLDELKKLCSVVELEHDAYLFWNTAEDGLWLTFAVMQFHHSESDGANTMLTMVFHGDGPSEGMRECRHTYWGDNGYLFYVDGRVVTAALKELSKFFDNMIDVPTPEIKHPKEINWPTGRYHKFEPDGYFSYAERFIEYHKLKAMKLINEFQNAKPPYRELTDEEKFSIFYTSGGTPQSQDLNYSDPDNVHLTMVTPPIGVVWDGTKFLIATPRKQT